MTLIDPVELQLPAGRIFTSAERPAYNLGQKLIPAGRAFGYVLLGATVVLQATQNSPKATGATPDIIDFNHGWDSASHELGWLIWWALSELGLARRAIAAQSIPAQVTPQRREPYASRALKLGFFPYFECDLRQFREFDGNREVFLSIKFAIANDKAAYRPGEAVRISVNLTNSGDAALSGGKLKLSVQHLGRRHEIVHLINLAGVTDPSWRDTLTIRKSRPH